MSIESYIDSDGIYLVSNRPERLEDQRMTSAQARELAADLLASADHADQAYSPRKGA